MAEHRLTGHRPGEHRVNEQCLVGVRVALVLGPSTGGIGQHVRSLATGLVAAGATVRVFGPRDTGALLGLGPAFVPLGAGSLAPAGLGRLARELRAADVVHAHGLRAGLSAALAVGATAYVVSWHNPPPPGAAAAWLAGWLAHRADITLAASDDLAARARLLGGRDVRLAPVGAPVLPVATRDRARVRAELGATDRPLLLAVGRLHPQKGHHTLVEAAVRWGRRMPAPLVVIAGDGPLRAELAAQIDQSAAPVRLLGRRSDIADLLGAADLVVLPSSWEARSLAAQEACRAGVPVVATAIGGLPGLLGDGAVLVPPDDAGVLADAVERLLDDPAAAGELAARGAARAARWPSESDTVEQVCAVYRELLGERR